MAKRVHKDSSDQEPSENYLLQGGKYGAVFVAVSYLQAVPAWIGSLLIHGGLVGTLAAITYKIEQRPEVETVVEVVMAEPDDKGKLEYRTREQLKVDQNSGAKSSLSEAIKQATTESLQTEPESTDVEMDLINVNVTSGTTSSSFGSLSFGSYSGPSGTYGEEIAKLKKVGLNVVFVFDSTGSMNRVIENVQQEIDHLMGVLFDLVPKARIGLVTYRDRGEAYVTKSVPLTRDRARIREWLFNVKADGGGDLPEAVDKGLDDAINMRWQTRAKKIILLFGDAEPHPSSETYIANRCKYFNTRKKGIISTIVTELGSPATGPFEAIAAAGGGESLPITSSKEITKKLLVLAFGSKWERQLSDEFKAKLK
ncbi:MAG: VWA domain-containing protein [Planctomycetota bacterium]|nr:VWA domain-containing protein [Planctomycetota bacterium]MDA1141614.1 VWA domain-containing protein [Planctomycetota bacterium]